MIVDNGKYYLYRHIRLDKNEPFYIGIGTKRKKSPYNRAITYHKENSIWKRIINKSEYRTEILLESDNYNFIKTKEEEFIKLYGRKNLQNGTLANLTNGGEGNLGKICSDELRKKRRINAILLHKEGKISMPRKCIEAAKISNTGKHPSEETKLKQYLKKKNIKQKPRTKIASENISVGKKKAFLIKGFPEKSKIGWFKKGESSKNNKSLEVLDLSTGIFYCSIQEAATAKNLNRRTLNKRLRNQMKNNTSLILLENEL